MRARGLAPSCPSAMRLPAVGRCVLAPVVEAVVAHDGRHAQAVVAEYAAAAGRLRGAMLGVVAPARHRVLVAPERQRQHLAGIGDALEALHRDEALDLLELRPQPSGMIEIALPPTVRRPHLEDDGDHGWLLAMGCDGGQTQVPLITVD